MKITKMHGQNRAFVMGNLKGTTTAIKGESYDDSNPFHKGGRCWHFFKNGYHKGYSEVHVAKAIKEAVK